MKREEHRAGKNKNRASAKRERGEISASELSHVTEQHVSPSSVKSLPLSPSVLFLPLRYKRSSQPIRMRRLFITLPICFLSLSPSLCDCHSFAVCMTWQHTLPHPSLSLLSVTVRISVSQVFNPLHSATFHFTDVGEVFISLHETNTQSYFTPPPCRVIHRPWR